MKKMIAGLLALLLILGCCLAEGGDPNIDGGGGGTGSGTGESNWNGGDDGVRVTIMYDWTPVSILDYSNKNWSGGEITNSFEKQCKLTYKAGGSLIPSLGYENVVPTLPLPRIISTTGASTIEDIRHYFTNEYALRDFARDSGMDYNELVSGTYKLMLEPISYFKYKGAMYAMTATEAALYDGMVGGDLRYWMGTLTHQNQPFSMFLEHFDLGIQPWHGATSGKQENLDILNYLGVGIVSFTYEGVEIEPPTGDYIYRTDTDVVTSFLLKNTGGAITPDSNATLTFSILGHTYSKHFVCPSGSSELVWVRWHTPSTPQDVPIGLTSKALGLDTTLTASIVELKEHTPPNPIYDGPGIEAGQYQPDFRLEPTPDWGSNTRTSWTQWYPIWHEPVYASTPFGPVLVTPGYWSFTLLEYYASLYVDYELTPDERVKTAIYRYGDYEMKSGYGVSVTCRAKVSGDRSSSNYDITPVQNVVAVFPEFGFTDYNRLLEPDREGFYDTTWRFKENIYSYYGVHNHFTPLWYPDMDYPVPVAVFDVWTPGGHLYSSVTDKVIIYDSVFDDWYIRVLSH